MHPLDRGEDLVRVEVEPGDLLLQLVRENVDEQLGVRPGVEVAPVDVEQLLGEFARVGEIAVVHEHDAVRCVHVERLRFILVLGGTLRGVAHVTEPHRAGQAAHVAGAVGLTHVAPGLVHVEGPAVCRGYSGRILSAVLQQQEAVINQLVGGFRRNNADNAAHSRAVSRP